MPEKPGVYIFLDNSGDVLYVGKAISLKARVSSYFTTLLGEKTRLLVSKINKIRVILVESELEALLLEAHYIKKYRPKYNIRLTDGKEYIIVRITNDKYPKVLLSRRIENNKDKYFGPFPNSSAIKLVLKTIRKAFPYQAVLNHPKRICLYHHLNLCPCPIMFNTPEFTAEYKKNIYSIIRIFNGETKKIIKEIEKNRDYLSKIEKFEDAAKLQKQIEALTYITQAKHLPYEYVKNPNLRSDIRQSEMIDLKSVLQNNGCHVKNLYRIECFDISNIQGKNAVASMVVFINGEKESSFYRRFKIRLENKPNDFAMMQEVIKRRIKHREWEYPGLMVIDGGKGQVSSVLEILNMFSINIPVIGLAKREETIIVPKPDLTFLQISLPKDSHGLHLLQRIRDEAHRFAVTYHKLLRSKAMVA